MDGEKAALERQRAQETRVPPYRPRPELMEGYIWQDMTPTYLAPPEGGDTAEWSISIDMSRVRSGYGSHRLPDRLEIPSFSSGRGMLDAPVVLRRVDGRTIQPPVRMGLWERIWRKVMGR